MNNSRWLFSVMVACLGCYTLQAQTKEEYKCYYTVGKPCPDFTFDHVVNYSKKKVSISDFRGKWLILDFWHKGCSACIKSFPKVNRELAEYGESVQFLLVGLQDDTRDINIMFDRLKSKMNLTIPCAFDSTLVLKVDELKHGMPFNVIIDPDGIVRGSIPIVPEDVFEQLTLTARPTLRDYYREIFYRRKYDNKRSFLVNGNGGDDNDFLFRSLLSKCDQFSPRTEFPDSINAMPGNFVVLGKTIADLYMYAYTGVDLAFLPEPRSHLYLKIWPKVVLEIKDSSRIKKILGKERYAYSLNLPPERATNKFMTRMMQQDLYNYFGYSAKLEAREMPCWKLVASSEASKKLRTKDTTDGIKVSPLIDKNKGENWWQLLDFTNVDMVSAITSLSFFSNIDVNEGPIVDETGIDFNIDFSIRFTPNDFNSVREALKKWGLSFVKGTRVMNVLVIRD